MSPKDLALATVDAVSSFLKKKGSRVEELSMKAELRKKMLQRNEDSVSGAKQAMDRGFNRTILKHPFTKKPRPSQPISHPPHGISNARTDQADAEGRQKVLIPKTYPKGRMDFGGLSIHSSW